MTVTVDFRDGDAVVWTRSPNGLERERVADYEPSLFVAGPADARDHLATWLGGDDRVTGTGTAERYRSLAAREPTSMLRVDLGHPESAGPVARRVRREFEAANHPPGTLRLYDVDLSPGFRFHLDTGRNPSPEGDLVSLRVDLAEPALSAEDASGLRVGGEPLADDERDAVEALSARLAATDPDLLVLSSADAVPVVSGRAEALGVPFSWGRDLDGDVPGPREPDVDGPDTDGRDWRKLAGENTFESYGRVGHSPARYSIPGRAILDCSNSFMWGKAGLEGLLYLVERSWRPVQEAGRASIGSILTSMQIRHARARYVPAPWRPWEPEQFKPMRTLHDADRGGVTLGPRVGYYEDVVELDFASLYPAIICEHNISAETVRCDCCDRADVPGIGYSICDREGFLPNVLDRLLRDRAGFKEDAAGGDEAAAARSDAIKWVLVSCFGYQGYRNAKFGRIECHEAINAIARDTLLDAKEALGTGGWEVLHAIVDSVWVRERAADSTPPEELAADVTAIADIPLELEATYDWVCFVPKRDSNAGALTKYFGRRRDGSYKFRGIECRQRSTPAFVADAQRDLIEAFDADRSPETVRDRLAGHLRRLERGDVDPADLVVTTRATKAPGEYRRDTLTAAALDRSSAAGVERSAGQSVQYVVVDDAARGRGRVRLPFEEFDGYDEGYYRDLLVRAAVSVVSPLGWDRSRLERELSAERDARLGSFGVRG
ncbi:type B DNA-directed DNA polymerase [Halorarum halophilum]|uniref:DNA-directed DNA polymerase n=1 Tax=Halorarum halophilum TaxID=2743090 RepID=A0A7D5KTG7_9EURY|nr:type B DNA-directed DNA polymerase [Halobaculum halophilum]QLG26260.1 type B DNA-directed DNA polymerase [Halobaculum halophilum]